jgi:hypothetical protein
MIDNLVDAAVATLLKATLASSGYTTVTVIEGIEDNMPDLVTPYLVTYSNVISHEGKTPVYKLNTKIDLVTLSGISEEVFVANVMSVVDATLNNQPSPAILAQINTTGLSLLWWQAIAKSTQEVGDRRRDVRELETIAQLS